MSTRTKRQSIRWLLSALSLASVGLLAGEASAEPKPMTRDEILMLFAERETAWRVRDAARLAADHAPDGIVVSPTGGVLEGRAEIERIYRIWFNAFPDLIFANEDIIVDDLRVALLCRVSGTHGGEFFGVPPTGHRSRYRRCSCIG
jgi:hypothetical protein